MVSFLAAFLVHDPYGGSMVLEGRGERILLAMNIAVFGFGLALLCSAAGLLLHHRRAHFGT